MLVKLSLVADLQIKFHNLTILLKYEAWKVDVLLYFSNILFSICSALLKTTFFDVGHLIIMCLETKGVVV